MSFTGEKWATAILVEDSVERWKHPLDADYALGFAHEPGQPGSTWMALELLRLSFACAGQPHELPGWLVWLTCEGSVP